MRKRLNLLSTLFHESANCLSKLPTLYWQPMGTFIVLLGLYAFWTAVILHLATASKFPLSNNCNLILIDSNVIDYPGVKSLKLLTGFADHNMTTNDSSIPYTLENNLKPVNGEL